MSDKVRIVVSMEQKEGGVDVECEVENAPEDKDLTLSMLTDLFKMEIDDLLASLAQSAKAAGCEVKGGPGQKLTAREWLCSGGWGHEDGEEGIKALRLGGDALVDALDCYREYLEEGED